MAEDSEPTATKLKSPELMMRSTLATMLGMKTSGVMVVGDSVPPNDTAQAAPKKTSTNT